MPRRIKTSSRRRPVRKSGRTNVPAATKRYVRRMMPKVELKRVVSYQDENSLATLVQGSAIPMLGVTQGVQAWNRIGNEIRVKGFHIKGILNNNATTPNYVRMVLAWTACDTDVSFTTATLFGDYNLAGSSANTSGIPGLNIMYFPINRVLYTPVYDKVIKLGGSGDPSCTKIFSKFIKMNKTIKYIANSTGTGVQNYQLTLFYLVAESGDDTTGGQIIEISHVARTFFTDC